MEERVDVSAFPLPFPAAVSTEERGEGGRAMVGKEEKRVL